MNFLMLSCKKATELIEKKSLFGLNWKENMQLKVHTKMCDACSHYQKQSHQIDAMLESQLKHTDESNIPQLENNSLKEEILHAIGE